MTQAKHTQGPWRMTKDTGRPVLVNKHGGRITYVDDDLREINARLIAAAPMLLEALQECLTFDGAVAERSHTRALERLQAINETARAAIKQAAGE